MKELQKQALTSLVRIPPKWCCAMREFTSFKIGGPADALVAVENIVELKNILRFVKKENLSYRVIGRGTNLLVQDYGFAGIILILEGIFREHSIREREHAVYINAGAAVGLTKMSAICMKNGYSGLEFSAGIPGTVGGAVVMNAGAWGGSMADVLENVEVVSQNGPTTYTKDELRFGYRTMHVPDEDEFVVTSAQMKLDWRKSSEIKEICSRYREQRGQRQPLGLANAGSIFKNPEGDSAGRLIEASGLKGRCVGDAEVSDKHANFIVNKGNATAADVLNLMEYIQNKVQKDSGIALEPEVHIL